MNEVEDAGVIDSYKGYICLQYRYHTLRRVGGSVFQHTTTTLGTPSFALGGYQLASHSSTKGGATFRGNQLYSKMVITVIRRKGLSPCRWNRHVYRLNVYIADDQ